MANKHAVRLRQSYLRTAKRAAILVSLKELRPVAPRSALASTMRDAV
jgi:hypothetical protein